MISFIKYFKFNLLINFILKENVMFYLPVLDFLA